MTDQSVSFTDFQALLKTLQTLDHGQQVLALEALRKSRQTDQAISSRIMTKSRGVARTYATKALEGRGIADPEMPMVEALADVIVKEVDFWGEPYFVKSDDRELEYWIEHTLNWYDYNDGLGMFIANESPRDREADSMAEVDRKFRLKL